MKKKQIYTIASLFSGCGGMDLGAEGGFQFLHKNYKKLPIKIVYSLDWEQSAAKIYDANFSLKCHVADIRNVPSKQIPNHDILTGGFPCQSFSVVAQNPKRLGYKDEKGKLFFEMCRVIRSKQPKVFIAENVKGILSANKKEAFPLILKEFENCGYYVTYATLNSSHFGVPQKRERVFIIGFKNKSVFDNFKFPEPTTFNKPPILAQVLENESEIDNKYYFSERAIAGLQKTKHFTSMNKGRVQSLDKPCNTVGAHLAKVSINSTDPILLINNRYRMFTPREVARIQSFPESFKLPGAKTALYRALGNAVPPVLMWEVTNSVIEAMIQVKNLEQKRPRYKQLELDLVV